MRRSGLLACALALGACVGAIGDGEGPAPPHGSAEPLCVAGPGDAGETPLRRLTRRAYANTVRDLLGASPAVADAFVADEKVGAFSSNAVAPITELALEGYMDAAEALAAAAAENLAALLPCDPAPDEEDCAEGLVRDFGRRAYRRPLSEDEVERLMPLYHLGREDGPFADGVALVVQGILQSPSFLYHVELGVGSDAVAPLTRHELATRLAFFLWSAGPDEALLDAAERGALDEPAGVAAEARRLLDDARSADAVASFVVQWLDVEDLPRVEKDAIVHADFDAELAAAMLRETERFTDEILRHGDGRLATLLRAPFTVADARLAALYGAAPADGGEGRVELDPAERSGLLTHASLLAKHAHAAQSSPVHRGKLVREALLCDPPPPPPPNVADQLPAIDPNASIVDQLAQHRDDPACAGCHERMDPIGTAFEAFDAVGAHRPSIGGAPVDDRGELVATDVDGAFRGVHELAERLLASDQVRRCFTRQWIRFALGRLEGGADACTEARAHARFLETDLDVRELIVAIATSDAMRLLRRPAEKTP
jgi:hypothetical protein